MFALDLNMTSCTTLILQTTQSAMFRIYVETGSQCLVKRFFPCGLDRQA